MSQAISVGTLPPPAAGASAAANAQNKKDHKEVAVVGTAAKVDKNGKETLPKTPLKPSLHDLVPKSLKKCLVIIPFGTQEEREEAIQLIAERISTLYSAFFTQQYHQNREKHLIFDPRMPAAFPPAEKVEIFKKQLKEMLIKNLRQGEKDDFVYLSTKTSAKGILEQLASTAGIDHHPCFYPQKTGTVIYSNDKNFEIFMSI